MQEEQGTKWWYLDWGRAPEDSKDTVTSLNIFVFMKRIWRRTSKDSNHIGEANVIGTGVGYWVVNKLLLVPGSERKRSIELPVVYWYSTGSTGRMPSQKRGVEWERIQGVGYDLTKARHPDIIKQVVSTSSLVYVFSVTPSKSRNSMYSTVGL
jgi:hypothetical protein